MGRYKEACCLIYKAIWAIAFVAAAGDILEALFSAACLVDLGRLRRICGSLGVLVGHAATAFLAALQLFADVLEARRAAAAARALLNGALR